MMKFTVIPRTATFEWHAGKKSMCYKFKNAITWRFKYILKQHLIITGCHFIEFFLLIDLYLFRFPHKKAWGESGSKLSKYFSGTIALEYILLMSDSNNIPFPWTDFIISKIIVLLARSCLISCTEYLIFKFNSPYGQFHLWCKFVERIIFFQFAWRCTEYFLLIFKWFTAKVTKNNYCTIDDSYCGNWPYVFNIYGFQDSFSLIVLNKKNKSALFSNFFFTKFSKSLFPLHILHLFKFSTNLSTFNTVSWCEKTSLDTTSTIYGEHTISSKNLMFFLTSVQQ